MPTDASDSSAPTPQTVERPVHSDRRARDEKTARTAILIVHGMGQQLPFGTLDGLVRGLRNIDALEDHTAVRQVRLRGDGVADRDLPRVEATLRDASGENHRPVHFYEGYWAPITEGQVTLRDVMSFLFSAGINGLRNASGAFTRYMFGERVSFPEQKSTSYALCVAMLVLISLIAINVVGGLVTANALLRPAWVTAAFEKHVTILLLSLVGVAVITQVGLFVLKKMLFFHVFLGGVILAGAALDVIILYHAFGQPGTVAPWPSWVTTVAWGAVLLGSWIARGALVQFVGDVAAYVSSHRLDRFAKIRRDVKRQVFETARSIYAARDDSGSFQYDRIAIVAHSLGSVVAYDTLNRLLNEDALGDPPLAVQERTPLLLTFGSPLDKIAFIFRAQGAETGSTRENLAAAKQPLIQDYQFRDRLKWVNVYSPLDIVSGALDLYDDPKNPAHEEHGVKNLVDPGATTPLVAHTEYWKTPLVFRVIQEELA
ncbi:MAG: hypothetical protein AAF488_02735 [Planctomycetota bacterium]